MLYYLTIIRVYHDKLAQLEVELDEIRQLRHPEVLKGIAQLKRKLKERLQVNDLVKELRVSCNQILL